MADDHPFASRAHLGFALVQVRTVLLKPTQPQIGRDRGFLPVLPAQRPKLASSRHEPLFARPLLRGAIKERRRNVRAVLPKQHQRFSVGL